MYVNDETNYVIKKSHKDLRSLVKTDAKKK